MLLWPAIAKMRAEPRPPIKLGTEPFTRKPISPPRASRAAYGNVIQKSYIAADTLQHTYRLESSQVERMRNLGMCNDRRRSQDKAAIHLEFSDASPERRQSGAAYFYVRCVPDDLQSCNPRWPLAAQSHQMIMQSLQHLSRA